MSIATPHIAGYSIDGKVRGTEMIAVAACKKFGYASNWLVENAELPESPKIDLTNPQIVSQKLSEEQLLYNAILSAYDIVKDDCDLRKITKMPLADRTAHFDNLRKNYPIRREFASQRVKVSPQHKILSEKLAALGFNL